MKTRLIVGCTLAFSLGATLLLDDERWKNKPYTEWTLADVRSILLESAWPRAERTDLAIPAGSGSGMSATNPGGFTTVTPATVETNSKGQPMVIPGTPVVKPPAASEGLGVAFEVDGTIQWAIVLHGSAGLGASGGTQGNDEQGKRE